MKKKKRVTEATTELPFATRDLLRRRMIALAVRLPAESPELLEDKRALPPKRGSTLS